MSSETPVLVQFKRGHAPTGETSKDGMPVYEPCIIITLDRPPLLSLTRRATEEEFELYADAYKLFLKTEHAKSMDVKGYPLAMWPVIDEATLGILAGRDIFSVEQLSELHKRKDLPPHLAELAARAKKFVEMQANTGKYEAMILERDRKIEALMEDIQTLKDELSRANRVLTKLREVEA